MDFDLKLIDGYLTIYCSKNLEEFSKDFIEYFNNNIDNIKNKLNIKENINLVVALTDDKKQAGFVYGESDFSGFFNDTGAFAYININGKRSKESMFKGLMHELVHHFYKYYVYGENKKRITWVDEGLADFFSGKKEELEDSQKFQEFINKNLVNNKDINLNELNHKDKSFGFKNGYNLSYIAIRFLYETNDYENFINIISNYDYLIEIGNTILNDAYNYYCYKNSKRQ